VLADREEEPNVTRWLLVTALLAALSWSGSLYLWHHADLLPAQVPTHWGVDGRPNQFTPRQAMLPQLLVFPVIVTVVAAFAVLLPWLSPRGFSMATWRPTFGFAIAASALLLVFMQFVLLAAWIGLDLDVGRWMLAGIFAFFGLLGCVLGKVGRNFFVGVRTPWTLASPVVWDRTHRFAGWTFLAAGLIGFVLNLAGASVWVAMGLLLGGALTPVFYSLVLYKLLERQGKLDS
jgi:uncharacterized membrane protein